MKRRLSILVSLHLLALVASGGGAVQARDTLHFDGYVLGITLRRLEADGFLIADAPLIQARVPLGNDAVKLAYGGHLMWGMTAFFVDWTFTGGLQFYPFGERFSVKAAGHVGSFFLDNLTTMGAVGIHLDVPTGNGRLVSFGFEYFHRDSRDLLDWVAFPETSHGSFGASGRGEAINLDSSGIGVSVGFRY